MYIGSLVQPNENQAALRQRMTNNLSLTEANQSALVTAMSDHFSPGADLRAPEKEIKKKEKAGFSFFKK